jgi:hypothetical protein
MRYYSLCLYFPDDFARMACAVVSTLRFLSICDLPYMFAQVSYYGIMNFTNEGGRAGELTPHKED